MAALIIIDMQSGLFTEETPRFDSVNVIKRINNLSSKISSVKGKVIFIQHNGPKGDVFEPGTKGWKILPELERRDSDIVIGKTICDSFYSSGLDDFLKQNGINEIIITGCATDFCVDTTIRSAVSKGYSVTVVSDAHTTADRPHLKAEAVVKHHNWMWENLIVPFKPVNVVSCDESLRQIE